MEIEKNSKVYRLYDRYSKKNSTSFLDFIVDILNGLIGEAFAWMLLISIAGAVIYSIGVLGVGLLAGIVSFLIIILYALSDSYSKAISLFQYCWTAYSFYLVALVLIAAVIKILFLRKKIISKDFWKMSFK